MTPRDYTVETRENGRRIRLQRTEDPFIRTTITPRGWRVALAVLLRRYSVEVEVDGSRETIAHVMSGADPKGDGEVRSA